MYHNDNRIASNRALCVSRSLFLNPNTDEEDTQSIFIKAYHKCAFEHRILLWITHHPSQVIIQRNQPTENRLCYCTVNFCALDTTSRRELTNILATLDAMYISFKIFRSAKTYSDSFTHVKSSKNGYFQRESRHTAPTYLKSPTNIGENEGSAAEHLN